MRGGSCRLGCFTLAALLATATAGCSPKRFLVEGLGDALAREGGSFAREDDLALAREAAPFSLKLIESLLDETPDHDGLLLAACRGFTQYAFAFVQQDADESEADDFKRAESLRRRAVALYRRARGYGLRGLEVRHPGFGGRLALDPEAALRGTRKEDVPLLYWTAAAWGGVLSLSLSDPEAVAGWPQVEALILACDRLDPEYGAGAVPALRIALEMGRPGAADPAAARTQFERAAAMAGGPTAGHLVALAESVAVQEQRRQEFLELLEQASAIDPDEQPERRLETRVAQRRARWLRSQVDAMFLE